MEGLAKYKVPGGKLLIVKLRYGKTLESVQILGDFFLYPESSLHLIEEGLRGVEINLDQRLLSDKIAKITGDNKMELIGITPESIAQAVKMAVGG